MADEHPLKRYRKDRKLTLAALGKELDVNMQTVWRWENGRRLPRKGDLTKIRDRLGIEPAAILGFEATA